MSSSTETLSNFKEAAQSIMSTRHTWSEFLSLSALTLPSSFSDFTTRIGINLTRFLFHYSFILLFILLITLVYHPLSILLLLLSFAGWYFLFFSRDSAEPFSLFNLVAVDDRVVVLALAVFTLVVIAVTGVWLNVLLSVVVAAGVVCLHGASKIFS
ncbi:PRA1 family protein D-like [Cicer arietinum]|uniref:PRA1 family protein n=1 Tax=Cicer arietinum TaxID=3827 RepID=A0A1S2XW87_CICAR|nr:PRA1 family protein D-like [Cicer arietinum]